jgi:hypothetical protein
VALADPRCLIRGLCESFSGDGFAHAGTSDRSRQPDRT